MAAARAPGPPRRRTPGVWVPIDVDRKTCWVLVELGYVLYRDARRLWCTLRSRPAFRRGFWISSISASLAGGASASQHLHLLGLLLQSLR